MATSSIFTNVVIKTKDEAEMFADALDRASQQPVVTPAEPAQKPVTDIETIRKFMARRKRK